VALLNILEYLECPHCLYIAEPRRIGCAYLGFTVSVPCRVPTRFLPATFAALRVAATRQELRVLNLKGDWEEVADFLGAGLRGELCTWCHWRLQTSPKKSPCIPVCETRKICKDVNFFCEFGLLHYGRKICCAPDDTMKMSFSKCLNLHIFS